MNTGKTLFAQLMDFLPWTTLPDSSINRVTIATPNRLRAPNRPG